ncbi:SHOCT domain-containing protein [Dokdonia sp. Asnod1-B02]|uniref:SHOCT domain-containing protein n=1 Tax=Dokdonia sp. Asnod1-B02 TaxID=3160573 RepID=UPI0038686DBE
MNKIERLKELNDLLKSGVISESEFNTLKIEVIKDENTSIDKDSFVSNKQKINFKSFHNSSNEIITAPDIEFLDFKNISGDDLSKIKPFLELKQIYAPSEMTADEISLFSSNFSEMETNEIISRRPGLNYTTNARVCLFTSIGVLVLVIFNPLLIFICGFLMVGVGIAGIGVLNKGNATNMDKNIIYLSFALIAVSIAIFKFS